MDGEGPEFSGWRMEQKTKKWGDVTRSGGLTENRFMAIEMVRPERFELPTPWFVAKYSIQLS
jgi:hypothetical protein